MATAEEMLQAAEIQAQAKAKADRPLPAMAAPITNLIVPARAVIARYCRDKGISWNVLSQTSIFSHLLAEGVIDQATYEEWCTEASTKKRGGGGQAYKQTKEENEALKSELEQLRAQLAALQAAKGELSGEDNTIG